MVDSTHFFIYLRSPFSSHLQHVNKETVNDIEELQLILNKALKALQSLLTIVRKQFPAPETPEGLNILGLRVSRFTVI
jgi:hypothetical protein